MARKSSLTGWLGVAAALGLAGYVGARYLRQRAAQHRRQPRTAVDWNRARWIATRVAADGAAPLRDRARHHAAYAGMVRRSELLVAEYMGVRLPQPIEALAVVDRAGWIDANLQTFGGVIASLEALHGGADGSGALDALLFEVNRQAVAAQLGAMLGYLARRVLGQYDLGIFAAEPAARGTLYFVEPNIDRLVRSLDVPGDEFRLWIALHETTHVFQFEAFPWVRPYFADLVQTFIAQTSDQLGALAQSLPELAGRLARRQPLDQHWIEWLLTPEQRVVFDQIQALMSVIEGYSNHTMNAIGQRLLPSYARIERQVTARRLNRPLLDDVVNRVTGMDLKLAQYQQGEAFIDAVVAARGIACANLVWRSAADLPTIEEIREPARWIARVTAQSPGLPAAAAGR
jgi:coenzyme F420 biosynthesis associated uncharacterized protein